MPVTTPARTGIVNALDARWDAIAAGSTYNTTPKITQYRVAPFQTSDYPAINLRVLGQPQPEDLLTGKWNNRVSVAADIAAQSAAEYHNTLVDMLVALDTDLTLGGLVFDINFLGDELSFDQETKAFVGGTAVFEFAHRSDDMRI
jgi:hypothetical protein